MKTNDEKNVLKHNLETNHNFNFKDCQYYLIYKLPQYIWDSRESK